MSKSPIEQTIVLKESDLKKAVLRSFKRNKWELKQTARSTKEQVHRPLKRKPPRFKKSPLEELNQ